MLVPLVPLNLKKIVPLGFLSKSIEGRYRIFLTLLKYMPDFIPFSQKIILVFLPIKFVSLFVNENQ